MNRFEQAPSPTTASGSSLADLPLRSTGADALSSLWATAPSATQPRAKEAAAPLGPRAIAFAADVAVVVLIEAVAVLAAAASRGALPSRAGLSWAAAFEFLLFGFATVFPLTLFGRTVGMAVAGLAARSGTAGRRLEAPEAFRRWLGTVMTVVTLGAALLWTFRSRQAPTLADRLSGRALEEEDSEV